eukprot:587326-Pelagomonas_calceolata.AAC.2
MPQDVGTWQVVYRVFCCNSQLKHEERVQVFKIEFLKPPEELKVQVSLRTAQALFEVESLKSKNGGSPMILPLASEIWMQVQTAVKAHSRKTSKILTP